MDLEQMKHIFLQLNEQLHSSLILGGQSTKVLFIMDGEFLRFNDDETKTFIHEMYRLSGVVCAIARRFKAERI